MAALWFCQDAWYISNIAVTFYVVAPAASSQPCEEQLQVEQIVEIHGMESINHHLLQLSFISLIDGLTLLPHEREQIAFLPFHHCVTFQLTVSICVVLLILLVSGFGMPAFSYHQPTQ